MPLPTHHIDLGPADGQVAPPDADVGVRRLIQATCSSGIKPRVCKTPRPSTIRKWIELAKRIQPGDTIATLRDRLPDLFGARTLTIWRAWLGHHYHQGPRNPYVLAQQLLAALPAHLVQREP